MDDLTDIQNNWLIVEVSRTKDTTHLIKWLRDGGAIKPELAVLIADILSGKIKASPKKKIKKQEKPNRYKIETGILEYRWILNRFKTPRFESDQAYIILPRGIYLLWHNTTIENLLNHEEQEIYLYWSDMRNQLELSGYSGETQTKGEITKAAKYLTAHQLRITLSQLDEIIIKRKRKK